MRNNLIQLKQEILKFDVCVKHTQNSSYDNTYKQSYFFSVLYYSFNFRRIRNLGLQQSVINKEKADIIKFNFTSFSSFFEVGHGCDTSYY